jgi:hypothetical protein
MATDYEHKLGVGWKFRFGTLGSSVFGPIHSHLISHRNVYTLLLFCFRGRLHQLSCLSSYIGRSVVYSVYVKNVLFLLHRVQTNVNLEITIAHYLRCLKIAGMISRSQGRLGARLNKR